MFCWKFEEEFVVGTWKLRNKPTKISNFREKQVLWIPLLKPLSGVSPPVLLDSGRPTATHRI